MQTEHPITQHTKIFLKRRSDYGNDPICSAGTKASEKTKRKKLKGLYKSAIAAIAYDYTIRTEKKGDLAGLYGYDIYYNKTNYEIAYRVAEDDGQVIIIVMAGTRENFYEELKRYMR